MHLFTQHLFSNGLKAAGGLVSDDGSGAFLPESNGQGGWEEMAGISFIVHKGVKILYEDASQSKADEILAFMES